MSAEEEELEGSHLGVAVGASEDKSQEECYLTRSWPGVGMYVHGGRGDRLWAAQAGGGLARREWGGRRSF